MVKVKNPQANTVCGMVLKHYEELDYDPMDGKMLRINQVRLSDNMSDLIRQTRVDTAGRKNVTLNDTAYILHQLGAFLIEKEKTNPEEVRKLYHRSKK